MPANRPFGLRGGALALAVFGLTGCGNGDSAVQTRERPPTGADVALTAGTAEAQDAGPAPARPALTANRRETVDAKIARLFERNGADFGARSAEDYLARVEAFTKQPPSGTDRIERPNGDVLLYQASTNTFAVVSRDGAPRTMFKPRDGAAYWAEQKAQAPTFGQGRGGSSAE